MSRFRLKDVVWELTLRCNMACHHCGSNALDPRPDELSPEQVIDVATQLADVPVRSVCLSGGEALLNPKWPEVVRILTGKGVAVSTITNGITILDSGIFAELCSLREKGHNLTVSVSIDGLRETHNMIRGIDCFDRGIAAVRKLRAHGFYAVVQSTANRKNLAELPALRDFLFDDVHPSGWQMQVLEGYGRAGSSREWLLTLEEFDRLQDFWEETYRLAAARGHDPVITGTNCMGYYSSSSPFARDWQGCQAGVTGLGIDSNGNVRGCLSLKHDSFIEGSLKEQRLMHLWMRAQSFRYNREFSPEHLQGFCKECEWGPQCRGGCTSMSHSILGNPWEQPYCSWLASLHELNDDLVRLRAPMPEQRPRFDEELWANPAPDVGRLRAKNVADELNRAAGQKDKEERIYETFALHAAAARAAARRS